MIVDQDEIEALLAQADQLVQDTDGEEALASMDAPPPPPVQPPRRITNASPEVAQLLRIKVPVIVQLASRYMVLSSIRKMSLGMIFEFQRHIDDPLSLLINNHQIGNGDTVKVGEKFGLRITDIKDQASRIRSLGN